MARTSIIGTRMELLEAKRVEARAQNLGLTVSDYLRSLILQDLQIRGQADQLAPLTAETALVTALLVGRMAAQTLGLDEAKRIEEWARSQAEAMVNDTLDAPVGRT